MRQDDIELAVRAGRSPRSWSDPASVGTRFKPFAM